MSTLLNWQEVAVKAADGDLVFQITGNVDTVVVTCYFWMPKSINDVESRQDRKDGEAWVLPLSSVNGPENRAGFVFRAAPILANSRHLFVRFTLRQEKTPTQMLVEQDYQLDLPPSSNAWEFADGIRLRIA